MACFAPGHADKTRKLRTVFAQESSQRREPAGRAAEAVAPTAWTAQAASSNELALA